MLISEADWSRFAKIAVPEDLRLLVYLKLDTITAHDFEAIATQGAVQWAESDPVHYVPANGLAISKISSVGLAYVLQRAPELDEAMQEDLRKLSAFVGSNGSLDIYEVAYSSDVTMPVCLAEQMTSAAEVCAQCGTPIEAGQAVLQSKTDTDLLFHRSIHVILCPACASQYDSTGSWMLWGMVAFAVLLAALGLASCLHG